MIEFIKFILWGVFFWILIGSFLFGLACALVESRKDDLVNIFVLCLLWPFIIFVFFGYFLYQFMVISKTAWKAIQRKRANKKEVHEQDPK